MPDKGFLLIIGSEAALCVLAVAALLYARLRELYRLRAALLCVRGDMRVYLKSADAVLSDVQTPEEVRRLVLMALKTLSSPELARSFALSLKNFRVEASHGQDGPIERAMKSLQASNPELAAKAQEAAFGSLFCAAILYADNVRIDVEREAAVRPDHVWARLGAMLNKLWPENSTTLPGPYVGAA